jgi:hypothetical protein
MFFTILKVTPGSVILGRTAQETACFVLGKAQSYGPDNLRFRC